MTDLEVVKGMLVDCQRLLRAEQDAHAATKATVIAQDAHITELLLLVPKAPVIDAPALALVPDDVVAFPVT